ncbi:MAG: hypothetical protein AAF607_01215 [Pseudomonadota bacterium]
MSKFKYPEFAIWGPIHCTDAPSELHRLAASISPSIFIFHPEMTFEAAVEMHCSMLDAEQRKNLHQDLKVFLAQHKNTEALRTAFAQHGCGIWPPKENHRAILQSACDRLCD